MKKVFIFFSLLAVLIAGTVGYYLYNKGPLNVETGDSILLRAADLYRAYTNDSAVSNKAYTGKIITVTGEVSAVSINQQQEKVIGLIGGENVFINCTMEQDLKSLQPAGIIKVKGICKGMGGGDADLGIPGDVYLTRCYLAQ